MKRFDAFFIFLFLLLSLFSGWWSYSLYISNDNGLNPQVGDVESKQNDVFRKSEAEFFYTPLGSKNSVFDKDQITTGIDSEANIAIRNSTSRISLKDLCHVIIRSGTKGFELDIRLGTVEASLNDDLLTIVDGDRRISAQNGPALVSYTKGQNGSQFKVIHGEVLLKDKDKSETLRPLLGLKSGEERIKLLLPKNDAYLADPKGTTFFKWSDSEQNKTYRAKIFEKNKLIKVIELSTQETQVRFPREGSYQWHIEDLNDSNIISNTSTFTLGKKPFYVLTSPVENEVFKMAPNSQTYTVNLHWQQLSGGNTKILIEKKTTDDSWTTAQELQQSIDGLGQVSADLPVGEYRWKLSGDHSDSQTQGFIILEQKLSPLEPPKITDLKKDFSNEIKTQGLSIPWPPVPQAMSYEVEFQGRTFPVTEPQVLLPIEKPGANKYRVRTLNRQNLPGAWSSFKKINLVAKKTLPPSAPIVAPIKTPEPDPIPAPTPPAGKPQLSWNGIEIPMIIYPYNDMTIVSQNKKTAIYVVLSSKACIDFEVEIDESKTFQNPTILKTKLPKGTALLANGSYQIRARCWQDGDMGSWSLVRRFKIQ